MSHAHSRGLVPGCHPVFKHPSVSCLLDNHREGALRDSQLRRKASQEFSSSRLGRMLKSLVCFLGKLLTINRCISPFTHCFLQTRATHETNA